MSMRASFQVNPNLKVEADCRDMKGIFKFAGMVGDLLGVDKCGNCGHPNISPQYRKTKEGWEYYSLKCDSCGHELKFGQAQADGSLFPKMKDGKDGWVPPFRPQKQDDDGEAYSDEHDNQDSAPPMRRQASPVSSGDDIEF